MPVRVKHRALQGDKSSFSRDWDRLLSDLVASMIAWPGQVSVSIREVSSRQSLSLRTGSRSRTWLNDGCRLLYQASLCDSPDASNWVSLGASAPGLSIDGYVCREPVATKRVQFISLGIEPLSNEFRCNILFEEVNKVFADSAFGAVDAVNDSDCGRKKRKTDGFTDAELKFRKGVDRWPMFFLKITPTPSAANRCLDMDDVLDNRQTNLALITDLLQATFHEFLHKSHCRPKTIDLSARNGNGNNRSIERPSKKPEEKTRSKTVPRLASSLMQGPARKTPRLETSDSRSDSPFDGWSRVKSGQTLPTFKESTHAPSYPHSPSLDSATPSQILRCVSNFERSGTDTAEPSRPPLYDVNGKLTRKPFDDIDLKQLRSRISNSHTTRQREAAEGSRPPHQSSQDQPIQWINPATNLATLIDPRTGFALPSRPLTLSRRTLEQLKKGDKTDWNSPVATSDATSWSRELVEKWNNPVFELTERPIPKLPDVPDMLGIDAKPGGHHCDHELQAFNMGSYHEKSAMGLRGRVSKDALRRAELITQVDNKFILVKVPFDQIQGGQAELQTSIASSSLLLIDQHAADERCRVESLFRKYFARGITDTSSNTWRAVTELLPKPLFFELSRQDRNVLCRYQQHFALWGICYDVETPDSGSSLRDKVPKNTDLSSKAKVIVRSLPPAILERCRTEPRLLSDLIRTEAWKLNDEVGIARQPKAKLVGPGDDRDSSLAWVSLFHGCPQGIIDLINSRSCRSAIMFNDTLTRDQCTDLLGRLVQCAFPFQCAHGRPSMVPLIDLGGEMVSMGIAPENEIAFGRKFKQWKQQGR